MAETYLLKNIGMYEMVKGERVPNQDGLVYHYAIAKARSEGRTMRELLLLLLSAYNHNLVDLDVVSRLRLDTRHLVEDDNKRRLTGQRTDSTR